MLNDLSEFIQSNRTPAIETSARSSNVSQRLQTSRDSGNLGISSGFISKWTQMYELLGVAGLKLGYLGSVGYLEAQQRQAVIT